MYTYVLVSYIFKSCDISRTTITDGLIEWRIEMTVGTAERYKHVTQHTKSDYRCDKGEHI